MPFLFRIRQTGNTAGMKVFLKNGATVDKAFAKTKDASGEAKETRDFIEAMQN